MQHLDLSDDEAAVLIKELADITRNDRYPFSPRIQALRAILGQTQTRAGSSSLSRRRRCTRRRAPADPDARDTVL